MLRYEVIFVAGCQVLAPVLDFPRANAMGGQISKPQMPLVDRSQRLIRPQPINADGFPGRWYDPKGRCRRAEQTRDKRKVTTFDRTSTRLAGNAARRRRDKRSSNRKPRFVIGQHHRNHMKTFRMGLFVWFILNISAFADDSVKTLILPGEAFLVEGRPAFILFPKGDAPKEPRPWIFYAPTLSGYPDEHEKWMHQQFLDAGIAVAGIDVGEGYGSPKAQRLFSAFYDEMTRKRGYALKPCLLGRSRGGLWVTSWACENPDKVAGIAGIYPVFDLRTYPGLATAAPAYELTQGQLAEKLTQFNPIERVSRLAKAKIPALFIHGDQDTVVPLKENSAQFKLNYQQENAGDLVTLIVAKGQGHNFWEGFFRCQELVDFTIARAKEGAATGGR